MHPTRKIMNHLTSRRVSVTYYLKFDLVQGLVESLIGGRDEFVDTSLGQASIERIVKFWVT